MPFNPEKKKIGDLVKSQDWNDAIEELVRLEKDKVNRSGNDKITGPLTIDGALSAKEVKVTTNNLTVDNNISVGKNVTINGSLATLGDVSIGTLTPENQEGWNRVLDIKGAQHTKLSIRTDNIDGRVLAHHQGFWGALKGMIIGTSTDHPLSFATKRATHMTILSNGHVGIGRNNPVAKLDIASATRTGTHPNAVKGLYVTGEFNPDNDGVEFRHSDATQGIGFGFNTIYAAGSNANQDLGLKAKGTGEVKVYGKLSVTSDLIVTGKVNGRDISTDGLKLDNHINTNVTTNPHKTTAADVGALSTSGGNVTGNVTVTGNVGIGTTNPGAKLEVNGALKVQGAGNVTGNLEVGGSLRFGDRNGQLINLHSIVHGIGVQGSTTYFRSSDHFAWYKGGSHNDMGLNAGTGGTALMVIKGDGNVGIGTTNPTAKLHVNGGNATINGNATISEQANIGGNAIISGNVGIGTTTPQAKLDVNGSLKVQGDVTVTGKVNGRNISEDGTKLNDHVNNKSNPHGVTATQLGALSLSGGNVTGNVTVTGNVGIGTTSPTAKLDVNGTLKVQGAGNVTGNLEVGGSLSFGNRNGQLINLHSTLHGIGVQGSTTYFRTSNHFAWYKGGVHDDGTLTPGTNGTALMVIKGDGNVGIGTTNPTAKLHVNGGNADIGGNATISGQANIGGNAIISGKVGIGTTTFNEYAKLQIVGGDIVLAASHENNKKFLIHCRTGQGGDFLQITPDTDKGDWAWASKGITLRRIDGNVGIGTDSPTAKLDVQGSVTVSGSLSFGNRNGQLINLHSIVHGIGVQGSTTYFRTSNHFAWYKGGVHDDGTLTPGKDGTALMVIKSDGNVGIGTTNPTAKLDVNGTLKVQGAGNVTGNLEVGGSLSFGNRNGQLINLHSIVHGIGVQGSTTYFRSSDHFAWYKGGSHNDIGLNAGTNGTALMVIKGDGNVGIGTNNPTAKLHVVGDLVLGKDEKNTKFIFHSRQDQSGDFLLITSDKNDGTWDWYQGIALKRGGSVGIGTNNPTKGKLHIEGYVPHYYFRDDTNNKYATSVIRRLDSPMMLTMPSSAGFVKEQQPYSLYTSHIILTQDIHIFSDERIKEIYNRSDSQEDLKTLLQIEVTDYSYRDKIAKGNGKQKKVIGQQIAKVFPQAVSTNTDVVCDIFQFATLSEGWVTLTNHGLKTGERVKLIWGEDKSEIFTIEAVTPDTFQISLDYCGDILVYGREVNDFHVVDYDALSMLHISATQELYKIIKKLEEKINEKIKD